jgi:glucose/arabinose dehydrogenase
MKRFVSSVVDRLPVHRARMGALIAGLAVMASVFVVPMSSAQGATTLPAGFTQTQVATGLAKAYEMAFAPDGRLFVTLEGGRVRVIKNGVLLPTPFLSLTVNASGDRGLIGIAFDPNFSTNHFVYVYYTATTPAIHNRVSRFTANGDVVVPGSEKDIFDVDNLGTSVIHNGGSLQFGSDGDLYITTGDNVQPAMAQDMTSTLGKVLRINPDGTIPTDNPFYNTTTGKDRAIWALGLRNPYTTGVDPVTGRYFIDDVGASTWEEIDEGAAGANYGWPTTEGPTNDPQFTGPLFAYLHGTTSTTGCAIAGGAFYDPPVVQFGSQYVGNYFFADHCGGWIRRLDPSNGNAVTDFIQGIDGPIGILTGPDGSLYYLSRDDTTGVGTVFKVSVGNSGVDTTPPTVAVSAPAAGATVSGSVTLGATATDNVGVTRVKWFLDGTEVATSPSGPPWTRPWNSNSVANGSHRLIAKARDAAGNWGTSRAITITVSNP